MIDLELREKVARLLGWWVDLHLSAPLVNGVPVADKMYSRGDYHCTPDCLPAYEATVADAWEVVEFMRERKKCLRLYERDQGDWFAEFMPTEIGQAYQLGCVASTAPLAICMAFMNAMENNHES